MHPEDTLTTMETALVNAVTYELAGVKAKSAANCLTCANFCENVHKVVKNAKGFEGDVSDGLWTMSRKVAKALKPKVAIIDPDLKHALKRVSAQTKTKLVAAISLIRVKHERDDSEALQNVAVFLAMLHSRVDEIRRILNSGGSLVVEAEFELAVAGPVEVDCTCPRKCLKRLRRRVLLKTSGKAPLI